MRRVGWAFLGVVFCWEVYTVGYLAVFAMTGRG